MRKLEWPLHREKARLDERAERSPRGCDLVDMDSGARRRRKLKRRERSLRANLEGSDARR